MSDDRAEAGLPNAGDYDPDAIGTAELSAGRPTQKFEEFGLELVPVLHSGEDTGQRIVRRNGDFLSTVSDEYKLLPNERAVQAANKVAMELDAVPFHEFDGDWFATLDDHVFQDPERRRVHAVYAWDKGMIGTDEMEYGFAVHNSIDGSLSFSVGLFSFRHACANMVFMGTRSNRGAFAEGVEEERQIMSEDRHRHTKGLDVDLEQLAQRIKGTLTYVDAIHDTYQQWIERRLTPKEVGGLIDSLPDKDLPPWMIEIHEELKEMAAEEEVDEPAELPWDDQAEVIEAKLHQAESAWKSYNSITENLWKRGDAQDTTRRDKMRKVHRVMNPGDSQGVSLR